MMDTLKSGRTLKPNGQAIKGLRLERGWRVADLAKKAGCSVGTVENVEAGANAYVFTLKKLAEAFGVDVQSLVQGAVPRPPQASGGPGKRVEVQITLSVPYEEFDECTDLARFMQGLLRTIGAKSDVNVVAVENGSVVIKLEMSEEDARKLKHAAEEAQLLDLSVYRVHIFFGPSWMGDIPPDPLDDIIHSARSIIWRATIGFGLLISALLVMGILLIAATTQAVSAGAWGREMMAVGLAVLAVTVAIAAITYWLVIRFARKTQRTVALEQSERRQRTEESTRHRPVPHREDA